MGVKYSDIIERMRWSARLKNDSAVARVLSVTPQALSNYKKRGEMPTDLVLRFAGIYNLSVDWLISGEGAMYKPGYVPEGGNELMAAHEQSTPYGISSGRQPDFASMTPDEIIYVGKLLKILRGTSKSTSAAIRCSVDAFCKAAEQEIKASRKPDTESE